ncbi:MAG TPA: hypothetical protein DDW94_08435 [Deltaproteobacteria bacterium]|nr:hypothetical protein [Deltaproteobacteria bacterium]HCY10940.1 hypothetical protein [Deltaproteobacteria bacterium]
MSGKETGYNSGIRLSVIIPAYNEEALIGTSLKKAVDYLSLKFPSYEIIVVCDGCKDSTPAIALNAASVNPRIKVIDRKENRGKGYSVKEGCLAASGEYVLFTDADLSTPMEEIGKLTHELEAGADIAIGSRAHPASEIMVHQAWLRESMGKVFNLFVRVFALKGLKDTQCGFKGFKREAARKIFPMQTIDGFSFDVEVLYIALKYGYLIREVPVKWLNRPDSRVNALLHPLQMLIDLVKIRFRDMKGAYGRV